MKMFSVKKIQVPPIITICVVVIFIILLQSCVTTEEKKALERRDFLVNNGGLAMFTKPPLEGETVLKTYEDSYVRTKTVTMSDTTNISKYNLWVNYRLNYPSDLHENSFSANPVAFIILAKAAKDFPDIDINEMDVRSVRNGSNSYRINISNLLNDKKKIVGYIFYPETTYYFSGTVVRVK
ncbi:hypothetical protein R84B8_02577 [Treponema sp. R8-4-B8]